MYPCLYVGPLLCYERMQLGAGTAPPIMHQGMRMTQGDKRPQHCWRTVHAASHLQLLSCACTCTRCRALGQPEQPKTSWPVLCLVMVAFEGFISLSLNGASQGGCCTLIPSLNPYSLLSLLLLLPHCMHCRWWWVAHPALMPHCQLQLCHSLPLLAVLLLLLLLLLCRPRLFLSRVCCWPAGQRRL